MNFVEIQKSTIHGEGLFALKNFITGDIIDISEETIITTEKDEENMKDVIDILGNVIRSNGGKISNFMKAWFLVFKILRISREPDWFASSSRNLDMTKNALQHSPIDKQIFIECCSKYPEKNILDILSLVCTNYFIVPDGHYYISKFSQKINSDKEKQNIKIIIDAGVLKIQVCSDILKGDELFINYPVAYYGKV
jgi:hypothetical protein